MGSETSSLLCYVTRMTAREALVGELFLNCLFNLRDLALRTDINVLSFPLIDWERGFLSFDQLCAMLRHVFSGTDVALVLYLSLIHI